MSVVEILQTDHVVVLARTIDGEMRFDGPQPDLGPTFLGRAFYEHEGMIEDHVDVPVWKYLELFYFRCLIPASASAALATVPDGATLLRAEVMVPTPGALSICTDWSAAHRNDPHTVIEYIEVGPEHLDTYRAVMVNHCGPAGAMLVESRSTSCFRALETRAVLYVKPGFALDWNQIHAHDRSADDFKGKMEAFDQALQATSPIGAGFREVFGMLPTIRKRHRWTLSRCHCDSFTAAAETRYGLSRAKRARG